jgi:hypothetical protein
MKASDLINKLRELIHEHGDLDTIVDCDSFPSEIDSVGVHTESYSQPPVFLIFPLQHSLTDVSTDGRKIDNG